jgi:hypothetical protein
LQKQLKTNTKTMGTIREWICALKYKKKMKKYGGIWKRLGFGFLWEKWEMEGGGGGIGAGGGW